MVKVSRHITVSLNPLAEVLNQKTQTYKSGFPQSSQVSSDKCEIESWEVPFAGEVNAEEVTKVTGRKLVIITARSIILCFTASSST